MKGNEDVVKVLNDVLSAELTGINQYFIHSMMATTGATSAWPNTPAKSRSRR
jgi:bacterioferritin (cytochrome b1)